MQAYSPYHNISPNDPKIVSYPPLLMTTSTRDDRVHPYHARCFVKRLLDVQKPFSLEEKEINSDGSLQHDIDSKGISRNLSDHHYFIFLFFYSAFLSSALLCLFSNHLLLSFFLLFPFLFCTFCS